MRFFLLVILIETCMISLFFKTVWTTDRNQGVPGFHISEAS